MTDAYGELLARHGMAFVPRECWLVVGAPEEPQGWKLHLSSTPREANALLTDVLPVFARRGTSFKVARDSDTLEQLNEGARGNTQVGKFVTVYDAAIDLVEEVCALTRGRCGPVVPSDLRLGQVVYARYGAYQPVIRKDPLGQVHRYLRKPDGSLVRDAYTVPFQPPDWTANPFTEWPGVTTAATLDRYDRVAERFLIVDVIRRHAKGDTFLALDLRSREDAGVVVLKQGRRHCMADREGRDIVDRLKHQERILADISDLAVTPPSRGFFEWRSDGYLAVDHAEGETIENFVGRVLHNRPWFSISPKDRKRLITVIDRTAESVQRLHERGIVHRDLTASNVLVDAEDMVTLVDLELASPIGVAGAFGKGTPGFMSKEQEANEPPDCADDIYALGQLLILATAGIDPRRLEFATVAELRAFLTGWHDGVDAQLVPLIVDCTRLDAEHRPSIHEFRRRLGSKRGDRIQPTTSGLRRSVLEGALGLASPEFWDTASGAWLSIPIPASQGRVENLVAHRSINRGNAGVIYASARLARLGLLPLPLKAAAERSMSWLRSGAAAPDRDQHGLHFGEAGVCLALVTAAASGLAPSDSNGVTPKLEINEANSDWLDVTHGAAGIALAALQLPDPDLATAAHCAAAILARQRPDGSWTVPDGVDGLSGETLTGFAHGVAGMAFAMLETGTATGDSTLIEGARAAASWLESAARRGPGEARVWPYGDRHEQPWNWWCHGGPGIALFLLRAYERLGDARYADLARAALKVHGPWPRSANLTLCHGLAGLGHALLEADRVLGERMWRNRAEEIANLLEGIAMTANNGGLFWMAEHPEVATADFMVGNAGIVDFLAQMHAGRRRLPHPLLP